MATTTATPIRTPMTMMADRRFDYLRDPAAIYARSFAIARAEADLDGLDDDAAALALRLIHACGRPDLAADLVVSPDAPAAGRAALAAGAAVLTDAEMVAHGIIRRHLPASNPVVCRLTDPRVPGIAARIGNTRSAAAVDLWDDHLAGAVVAIGNAPTALYRLLERLAGGAPRPALVIGLPVGLVGAAESKQALIAHADGIPYITLRGRGGGSSLAAAAVNALTLGAAA